MGLNKNKINKSVIYIYFILFAFYFLQGTLYPIGSIISQSALFLLLLISFVYLIKTLLLKNKDKYYIIWTTFLFLNIFYFIITGNIKSSSHFSMFKNVCVCLTAFYPFYFLARKKIIKVKDLLFFFLIMFIVVISNYLFQYIRSSSLLESNDTVKNIGYSFAFLMPFVFLIKKRKMLANVVMITLMFFVIQGAKRGAIIVGAVILLIYFYSQFKVMNKKNKIINSLLLIISIAIMIYITYYLLSNNEFVVNRFLAIKDEGGSGRADIFRMILGSWYNSEKFINFSLGYGFAGSLKLTNGLFAHNDWLEAISNFGLLGFLLYFILFVMFASLISNKNYSKNKRLILACIVAAWFFTSLFSMWYTSLMVATQTMLLGILIGDKSNTFI